MRSIVTCLLKHLADAGGSDHVCQLVARNITDMQGERNGSATADALPENSTLDHDDDVDDVTPVQYDQRSKRFRFDFHKDVESRVLDDYMHRGDELENMTLWEVISTYTRDDIGKQRNTDRGNRILFRDSHPVFTTHALCPFKRPRIPVLNGFGMLPRRAAEPELHALISLTLFVPWRNVMQILGGARTFAKRFRHVTLPPWAQAIISNWAEWTRAESDKGMSRADLLKKQHDPNLEQNQPVFQPPGDGGDIDGVHLNIGDDDDHPVNDDGLNDNGGPEAVAAPALTTRTLKALSHATDCALIGGGFTGSTAGFSTPRTVSMVDADVCMAVKSTMDRYAAAATANGALVGDDVADDPPAGTIEPILAAAARAFPLDHPCEPVQYDALKVRAAVDSLQQQMSVVDANGQPRTVRFNQQQHFAISIAAVHVLYPALSPLRMCVIGDAGCGKTVFAKAFRLLLDQHGRSDELRVMAWTGSAARTAGGQTICTALSIGPFTRTPTCSAQIANKLRHSFTRVKYIIIVRCHCCQREPWF